MGFDMKVSKAIPNGLEYLNITSPTFKKSDLPSNDEYYLIDSYVAGIYADRLNNSKLKGKLVLTSENLSYFTSANVRSRFDSVVDVVKKLNKPYFMIHNEVLSRELMIDPKKVDKLGKTAAQMVSTIKDDIDGVVVSIPKNLPKSGIQIFIDNVTSVVPVGMVSFYVRLESMEQTDSIFDFLGGFMTKKKSKLFVQTDIAISTLVEKYKFSGEIIQIM